MAWTELTFPSGSLLTSAGKMNPFFQNLYALVNGDAGAPQFETTSLDNEIATTEKFPDAVITEDKVAVPVKFPVGTRGIFFQAGAPTGWTQVTEQNDRMLRVVSGAGGGTGGAWGGGTTGSGGGHTHTSSSAGGHRHTDVSGSDAIHTEVDRYTTNYTGAHSHTASGGAHTHVSLDSAWRPSYIDIIICSKD